MMREVKGVMNMAMCVASVPKNLAVMSENIITCDPIPLVLEHPSFALPELFQAKWYGVRV